MLTLSGENYGYTKIAWRRNRDIPIGQPAPGRLNCPCGQAPETRYRPATGNVTCGCGNIYTWDGWIVARKLSPAELADLPQDWLNPMVSKGYHQSALQAYQVDEEMFIRARDIAGALCQEVNGRYYIGG